MSHEDLTIEKIKEALYYLDVEDRQEWVTAAMCLKSELGDSGRQVWLDWSACGSTFKLKDALAVWKTVKSSGKTRIGTLIYMAIQRGFKLGEYKPVSKAVQAERKERRIQAEKEAELEIIETEKKQAEKAVNAKAFFESADVCTAHAYTNSKDVGCYGLKSATWVYFEDNQRKEEENALIMPLMTFDKGIVSLQAIFADGTKKMMGGAQKSGAFHIIGDDTNIVVIGEGYATCATIHEATGFQVLVAMDAGNLVKVAIALREQEPNARIIIAADNDQYTRTNTGLKSATKACCEVDAEMVYPVFKNTDSKPTDFNDLAALEGLDEVKKYFKITTKYNPKPSNASDYDAWDLPWIDDAQKVLETSDSEIQVACAAKIEALRLSKDFPAFVSIEDIRQHINHKLVSRKTHISIMKQVQWSIANRKRMALSAIKPESWGNKHNHIVVSSLDQFETNTPVTLVIAPMGSGKTKNVIKPFSEASDRFLVIAHRRSLIADLSEKLNVSSYESIKDQDQAIVTDKMAVCLPSTQSQILKPFVDRAVNVAIDEISQNIRFTRSVECKVNGANQDAVFMGLQEIVSQSEKVIACDASIDKMTIDFFESARPDEKFTIVEQAPKNNDRKCFLYAEKDEFLTSISLELGSSGKVWLAVESADKAEILKEIFGNYKTIVINSKTTKTKEVREFLDDIENKSREYDLVIASPAISSGVSIEHKKPLLDERGIQKVDNRGKPMFYTDAHFTMIAGMASGHSICFSDFAQMLGRVRYVKDYHIHLIKNNCKNSRMTELSILTGLRQAATIEGGEWRETEYSTFKAHIEVKEDVYRSDFANGLVWFLEHFCFKIKNGQVAQSSVDLSLAERMKELSDEKKAYTIGRIKTARKISQDEADLISSSFSMTEDQSFELQAFRIRASFRMSLDHDICDDDIDMYENLSKVERFASMLGLSRKMDETALNISLRKFQDAKIHACKGLFDGFDLWCITQDDCDRMINHVAQNSNRFMLSALKLVPSSYGEWKEDKTGKLKDYAVPSKTAKSVATILDKFGLTWSRSSSRKIGNYYTVNNQKYEMMKKYAEMRYS